MEATVIDFILSTLMGLSAQYPDAAWLVTALSVVMTVCGLCAVATVCSPYLIAMTVLLLARAVALPVVTRRTTLKPVVTGITEAFASFIAFGCIIAAI